MSKILHQFWLPIFLCAILGLIFKFGSDVPVYYKQIGLSLGITIKSLILFVLPFCIIIFISNSLLSLRKKALKYFITLIAFVFISDSIATLFGYGFFQLFAHSIDGVHHETLNVNTLTPLFDFQIPQFITNSSALIIGFGSGIVLAIYQNKSISSRIEKLSELAIIMLRKIVIPVLPIMIAGFALKTQHEGVIDHSILIYGKIFLLFTISQLCYVIIVCMIACGFSPTLMRKAFTSILPATLTGLSTFSSAATMPLTIHATEQILKDKNIARSFIPSTVNIHLVGTIIGANIIILSTLIMFEQPIPSFGHYLHFTFYYVIAMFAAVAVPGGTIFAIIPIIEMYLGASPEMISIITTLVLLFDPIDTSFNITANALLARIFEKIYSFVDR